MSTANWRSRLAEGATRLGWLAAVAIVAWSPFAGGPRVPSAALGAVGLCLLALRGRAVFARPAARRGGVVFALLWLPALASLPASVHAHSTFKVVGVLALYSLTGLGLVACASCSRWRHWLLLAVAAVLALWIADSYAQYLLGRDLLGIPLSSDGRVVGMFEGNLRQAVILAALSPLLMWPLARARLLAAALGWLALLGVVMLSGVRGAWVVAVIAGAAFAWHHRARLRWRWLAAGAVLVLAVALQSTLVEDKLAQTAGVVAPGFESLDRALGHRLVIWETALRMLAERPLVGVGAGAFDEAYPAFASREHDPFRPGRPQYLLPVYHAHHMWISVAAESGLAGLAGLLGITVLCIVWYRKAGHAQRAAAGPYGVSLAAVAFPLNSQPVLFTNWWLPIMLLLTCMFLACLDGDAQATGGPAAGSR